MYFFCSGDSGYNFLFLKLLCFHFQLRLLTEEKKKTGSERKMKVERQKSWPEGSPYGGHEADGGSQACMG